MKVSSMSVASLVCGLIAGIVIVWSSAAPGAIDATALRGAAYEFCNCTDGPTDCSGRDRDCGSTIVVCHTGTATHNMCGETTVTCNCTGGEDCSLVGEKNRYCYTE
jgi:hypothetical protein